MLTSICLNNFEQDPHPQDFSILQSLVFFQFQCGFLAMNGRELMLAFGFLNLGILDQGTALYIFTDNHETVHT
jgi:hypothetical protein